MSKLTATEHAAWRGFLETHTTLWKALETDLLESAGLNLTAYEALLFLEEASDQQLRMTQLAQQIGMSGSGLTRVIDRLQERGLVERRRCEADGRGYEASLTPAGRSQLKRLHVTHLRAVRKLFLDRLTPAEQASLAAIWQRLATSPDTPNTDINSTKGA